MDYEYKNLTDEKTFDIIHSFTAYWERDFGDYTNSSIDRGGITRNGVTLGFLKGLTDKQLADIDKNGVIDKHDILAADEEAAKNLFHYEFWENGRAYCCPKYTAMVYYDFSVNSGSGTAAKHLQIAIDKLKPGTIVEYANNLGPKTRTALEMFTDKSSDVELAIELLKSREAYVKNICKNDTSQTGNLQGWMNRITALQKLIIEQATYCG